MDQGADIITQHTDSTAALQAAAERNVLAFGQASDMIQFAPSTQLTSIIDEWGPYYVERTQAVLDGTWTSGDTWHGMSDGLVVMAPYTNMPNDVATLAAETAESIRTGAFHPFTGPIYNQAGELVVPEGEVADDGMLAGMMPGMKKAKAAMQASGMDDKVLVHMDAIMGSMTPKERTKPALLNAKRKKRVAAGSGTDVQTVNKVLKMHQEMGRAMKQIKKMGGMKGLGALFGGGGMGAAMPGLGGPGSGAGGLPGMGGGKGPGVDPSTLPSDLQNLLKKK